MMKKMAMMITILMMGMMVMAGCGKSDDKEVETMAPGSYEIQDEGGSATLYIPEEDVEPETEEAIGDVDMPNDSFGRLTLDSMMKYSVGLEGDMVVVADEKSNATVEDAVDDLEVLFPMKPYYEGEIETPNNYTQYIASNGDYNYQIAFMARTANGLKQTAEDEGGILYEETDNYIIDVQHGSATDVNEEVKYGGAKINVYNKTTGVRLEVILTCGVEEGAAEGTGARFGEFDEWVRANVELIYSKIH